MGCHLLHHTYINFMVIILGACGLFTCRELWTTTIGADFVRLAIPCDILVFPPLKGLCDPQHTH